MNNSKEKFSIKKRLASFRFAFEGLKTFFRTEHNAWLHSAAMLAVIAFGVYYKISRAEWTAICIVTGLVFSMEIINTGIEKLCDFIHPEKHDAVKQIKDISAAAVLFSAIVALVTGLIIFLPKMI